MLGFTLLFVSSIAILGILFLCLLHSHLTNTTVRAHPAPGKMVNVGGHRLHYVVRGQGEPIVVIDACLNEASYAWFHVQEELAKLTTVVCYDRAGHGWSEPGPIPRTHQRCVGELRQLLQTECLQGPYLLCGHSYGGVNSRLYASLYPHEVAGVVLVETLNTDTFSDDAPVAKPPVPLIIAECLSALGTPRVVMPNIYNLPNVPKPEGMWMEMQCRSSELRALCLEWKGMANWQSVRDLMRPLDDMPVTVISANCERYSEWWPETQEALARNVGTNVEWVKLKCGHLVNIQDPQSTFRILSQ